MTLSRLLKQPLRRVHNSFIVGFLVIALLGFADAGYLTIEHFKNVIPPCTTSGCETVLTSQYATIAGIPIALLGAIYYLCILVGTFAYLEGQRTKLLKFAFVLTWIGFIVSVILVALQAFVIHSFCQYCLGSATITTILFILSLIILRKYRETSLEVPIDHVI